MNLPNFVCEADLEWLLEEVDPDWTDHFQSVDQGIEFYLKFGELDEALKDLEGQKINLEHQWNAQDDNNV